MSNSETPDEILHAFSLEPVHDKETIDRYLTAHPELATDLFDLLVDIRLSTELLPTRVERESQECLDASFGRFMASGTPAAATTLFEPFKGQAFIRLAKSLNVPRAFLTAVRDRLVTHTTIPTRFINRLASAMQETPDKLRSYFILPPVTDRALNFRADGQPGEVNQVPFSRLVEDTEMDEVQRSLLRNDLEDDGSE